MKITTSKFRLFFAGLGLIGFGASFIFVSLADAAEPDAELKIAVVQEWSQLNPVTINLASTDALIKFAVREMEERTASGEVVPDLAEIIPSQKNKLVSFIGEGASRKVVAQWSIKANAKWGDQKPVTCKDWWLAWQIGLSPNVTTLEKSLYTKIAKIEWTPEQPKKCKVTYATDDWTFDRDLPPPVPAHIEEPVFEKWKSQAQAYEQNSTYVKNPTLKGLYNGPYVIQEYTVGSHFILVKNPEFYGQPAQIAKIFVKHIGDASTLRSHLQTGSINMISAVGFPPDQALLMDSETSKKPSTYKVHFQDSPIFQGLFFNLDNEILKDIKVREALWKLIDKEELVQAFFQGKVKPAETFLAPQSAAFTQRPSKVSVAEAKKILDEAGWKANAQGVRAKDGKTLSLEFRTSSGIKILETVQTYVCSQFQKAGIQCLVKNQPPRIFLGDSVPRGDFTLAMFGQPILPDSSLRSYFSSKEIPTKENAWTGGNSIRWRNPKADELVQKFDREWNPTKRIALVRELETLILKDKPFLPLYHRREATVMPKSLEGFQDDINGTNFIFPEKWTLKK